MSPFSSSFFLFSFFPSIHHPPPFFFFAPSVFFYHLSSHSSFSFHLFLLYLSIHLHILSSISSLIPPILHLLDQFLFLFFLFFFSPFLLLSPYIHPSSYFLSPPSILLFLFLSLYVSLPSVHIFHLIFSFLYLLSSLPFPPSLYLSPCFFILPFISPLHVVSSFPSLSFPSSFPCLSLFSLSFSTEESSHI